MKAKAQVSAGWLIALLGVGSGLAQHNQPAVHTNICIYQARDAGATNCSRSEFPFTLASQGKFYVSVQAKGIAGQKQEMWINVDKEPNIVGSLELLLTNESPGRLAGYVTNTPLSFDIREGTHKLIVVAKSTNTHLEKLTLIPEAHLPPRPRPPEGLSAQ